MNKKIVGSSAIWDLHIHTCNSLKSTGEFKKMNKVQFVDKLLTIFPNYEDLQMISFTDHNKISIDVYNEFYSRKSNVFLLPGIEIDVTIPNVKEEKHLILYFDYKKEDFESIAKKINDFLANRTSADVYILFDFLVGLHINFVVSPHAFKQGVRSIDVDWSCEEKVKENAHKYMDQFYCFWEAAGQSSITHAVNFLKEFESDDKISVVSFSDSNDEVKLLNYLDNPTNYFNSLPSYKGLQLVGTDARRITKNQKKINPLDSGNIIGKINFDGINIELSDKLNVIVGGRGTGKSLLLDGLALSLKSKFDSHITPTRSEYIKKFPIVSENKATGIINIDSINIDYYNQAYVSKIFSEKDVSKKIEDYYSDEFSNIEKINSTKIESDIREKFNEIRNNCVSSSNLENISSFIEKYIKNKNQKLKLQLTKTSKASIGKIEFGNKHDRYNLILNNNKIIPKEIKLDTDIQKKVKELEKLIFKKIYKYNEETIVKNVKDYFIDNYISYSKSVSEINKNREEIEDLIQSHIDKATYNYVERVDLINSLISLNENFVDYYSKEIKKDGAIKESFKFMRELKIEKPVDYFIRMCNDYFDKNIFKEEMDINNLPTIIDRFCFSIEKYLKNSKKLLDFIDEIRGLKSIKLSNANKILYKNELEEYEDISTFSPGTQTNILMEYIVSKDTTIPLLIDQPEDNIDNETIYTKLTDWFNKLKSKRQIIVVTHDANIVINGDAENVIIATKINNDKYEYNYGALEYDNILDKISTILDGGVDAVERRLKKYGGKTY